MLRSRTRLGLAGAFSAGLSFVSLVPGTAAAVEGDWWAYAPASADAARLTGTATVGLSPFGIYRLTTEHGQTVELSAAIPPVGLSHEDDARLQALFGGETPNLAQVRSRAFAEAACPGSAGAELAMVRTPDGRALRLVALTFEAPHRRLKICAILDYAAPGRPVPPPAAPVVLPKS
jgi:hypothetical protein